MRRVVEFLVVGVMLAPVVAWADAMAPMIEPLISRKNPAYMMLWPGFLASLGLAIWLGWRGREAKKAGEPNLRATRGAWVCAALTLVFGAVAYAAGDGRAHPDPNHKPIRYGPNGPIFEGNEAKPVVDEEVKTTSPR